MTNPSSPVASPNLEDTIELVVRAHRGQIDKANEPYVLHPLRLMLTQPDEAGRMVALLHDVVEDTPITLDKLRSLGYSSEVVAAVDALTRRDAETYEEFIDRLAVDPLARRVKMADLRDNMNLRRIAEPTPKDHARLEKYQRALAALEQVG